MRPGTSRENEEPLSGCALPLNRNLFIYFYDPDFLKLCLVAQKNVLRRKERKKCKCHVRPVLLPVQHGSSRRLEYQGK